MGALQPLLVERFGLSLAQAGILGGVLVFSSSVTQPAYGYLSDRIRTRLFAALGPAVAGVFISALGIARGYEWLLAMVLLGGIGISMFHPQASSRAVLGIESKRGRAMAVFISAGTLGFACGPVYFSFLARRLGLDGIWWGAFPGLLSSALLLTLLAGAAGTTLAPPRIQLARPGGVLEADRAALRARVSTLRSPGRLRAVRAAVPALSSAGTPTRPRASLFPAI